MLFGIRSKFLDAEFTSDRDEKSNVRGKMQVEYSIYRRANEPLGNGSPND